MIFIKTEIDGVFALKPEPNRDKRGYFQRLYDASEFKKKKIKFNFVQVNQSMSRNAGTIRGIHMQKSPKSEDKLVQCIKGSIFDVIIDLREDSKTYGKWIGEVLEANKKMIFIPKGCAHGFQTLTKNAIVLYQASEYYLPDYEIGIRWNDPYFNIKWPIKKVIVSKKDLSWSNFSIQR